MATIDEIRKQIDVLDDQLLDVLNKRAKLALEVKRTAQGKTRIRPAREADIIRRLSQDNPGPLPNAAIRPIFTQIIASFRDQMQLERPISVSYLGPKGTYSEEAAGALFGNTVTLEGEDTISSVVRLAEAGTVDLAVIPVENSSEGAVRETHRLLLDTNLSIVSEITLPIIHCLLTNEKQLTAIKVIYGHPQALGQCRAWLATHIPKARLVTSGSNAAAAQLASTHPGSVAIASKKAGDLYNLGAIRTGINDQPGNETRFIALGTLDTQPTGNDKTSIIFSVHDKPGALHEVLGILAKEKISMTRLESQPYGKGEYVFYVDFIGHTNSSEVTHALESISLQAKVFKVLGSYPKGGKI